jgi:hypothetical protein
MAVTVITQSITTIVNSRGSHLRRGLTDLLQQLDPGLTAEIGDAIAERILTHPLVSGSSVPFSRAPRLGNVVHREEFTKLLMALAAGHGTAALAKEAREALTAALEKNGVDNPEATLENIRALSLQLERSSPELSNMARQNLAILHAAESDLVAKINTWFDQTMDRTSQRFTASTRAITFAGAFIVAFGLQVDTPSVVNRLAADDELRAAFVQQAQAIQKGSEAQEHLSSDAGQGPGAAAAAEGGTADPAGATGTRPATGGPAAPETAASVATDAQASAAAAVTDADRGQQYRAFLAENGLIRLPSGDDWEKGFTLSSSLGMLVTALLLSLGAPFWYSALGRLLQLRSVLAVKESAQRAERQSSEGSPAGAAASARSAVPALAGERGDLAALG